jgi:predicted  nucleic acid-binding Zn-ribbon protein
MDATLILQLLGAFGGLAGIGAIIQVIFNRKKTAAEAKSIVEDANTKIIRNLTLENERLQKQYEDAEGDMQKIRNQYRELTDRIAFYDLEMSDLRVLMMGNVNWAKRAYAMLQNANSELSDNNISLQFKIEPPPDSSALLAKFGYIENKTRDNN